VAGENVNAYIAQELPLTVSGKGTPMAAGSNRTHVRRGRRSPIFNLWLAIQARGPVAKRWRSFPKFYSDVHPKPSWRHLLVRTDTSGEFARPFRRRRGHGDATFAPRITAWASDVLLISGHSVAKVGFNTDADIAEATRNASHPSLTDCGAIIFV